MIGSWIDANRVIAVQPGSRDICVVTLVDGRRVSVDHALDYERARHAASELAGRLSVPVKVLPMGASELVGFLGLSAADFAQPAPQDGKTRVLMLRTCREVMRESDDKEVRREAYDLLVALGGHA